MRLANVFYIRKLPKQNNTKQTRNQPLPLMHLEMCEKQGKKVVNEESRAEQLVIKLPQEIWYITITTTKEISTMVQRSNVLQLFNDE